MVDCKKIELHCHLEGSMPPKLARKIAARNKLTLPTKRLSSDNDFYTWHDMMDFFDAYEQLSSIVQTEEDYFELTYEYLKQSAKENVIYSELFFSPSHAKQSSKISSEAALTATNDAIMKAFLDYGIRANLILVGVRNYGAKSVEKAAALAALRSFSSIKGFTIAGDEQAYPPRLFKRAYEIAHDAELGLSIHAGEFRGAAGILEAIETLPVTRLGHGVRAIESIELMKRLKDENIHLELCPSSNISLKLYPSLQDHPFRRLYDFGLRVSINSDDPPFFNTTIGKEYELAKQYFSLNDQELTNINLMAIESSFASPKTKDLLKKQL